LTLIDIDMIDTIKEYSPEQKIQY